MKLNKKRVYKQAIEVVNKVYCNDINDLIYALGLTVSEFNSMFNQTPEELEILSLIGKNKKEVVFALRNTLLLSKDENILLEMYKELTK